MPHVMLERRKGMAGPAIVREIARALGESATLADAAPRMLAAVCGALGWEFGALWEVDRGGKTLQCVGTWHTSSLEVDRVRRHQSNHQVRARRRSAGRVWEPGAAGVDSGRRRRPNFPRALAANHVGLHGAFALPILRGSDVLGVMEFFSRDIRQPDEALLESMMTACGQIGLYVTRKWAAGRARDIFQALARSVVRRDA